MVEDPFEAAYRREKQARLRAESLLEALSRELYEKNGQLALTNEELKKNQQALIQHEKMASVGLLSAGIAHEINNPLGYSLSNLGVLREYAEEITGVFEALAAMQQPSRQDVDNLFNAGVKDTLSDLPNLISESVTGLENVQSIVVALRNFARHDERNLSCVNINDCLDTTLGVLANEIKLKCRVVRRFGELPGILVHEGKINQVLANLVWNGVQAIEREGNLYLTTRDLGDSICIEISDDGHGVPDHLKHEIFTPFFTTKPVGEGTGLGLSIAYAIIHDEHHGSLELLDSGPGTGATFRITLPVRNT